MSQQYDFILKLKKLEKSYAIYRAGYTDKHIRVESRKYAFFYQSSEYLIARYSRTYSQVGAEAKQVSCSVFVFVVPCCAANLGNRERRVRDQTMAAACRQDRARAVVQHTLKYQQAVVATTADQIQLKGNIVTTCIELLKH